VRPDASLLRVVVQPLPWDDADRIRVHQQKANAMTRVPQEWWSTVAAPRSPYLGKHEIQSSPSHGTTFRATVPARRVVTVAS
jgi:hypothetical protein